MICLDNGKPKSAFPFDYDGLDTAFDLPIELDLDIADLGKVQSTMVLIDLEVRLVIVQCLISAISLQPERSNFVPSSFQGSQA